MNHRGKNGRNHEYQDSNDSSSTPEIFRFIIDIIGPQILMIVLFNIDQKLSIYSTLENLL